MSRRGARCLSLCGILPCAAVGAAGVDKQQLIDDVRAALYASKVCWALVLLLAGRCSLRLLQSLGGVALIVITRPTVKASSP